MLAALAAAAVLAAASPQWASVRVPVANVWSAPGGGHLPLDPHVWPTAAVTYGQRLALVGHMPTQVLYGERVLLLGRRGGWTRIAVPDQPSPLDRRGYPGWVRTWQLGEAVAGARTVTVTAPSTRLSTGVELSFATRLPLVRRAGRIVVVATPAGDAQLPAASVAPLHESVVATAKRFLGLRYLWGGLSAWGFDCSGLTWAVYRAHGVTIPRDADAQFAAGVPVPASAVRAGDLLFYGLRHVHHVALALGNGLMLESPSSASEVRIAPVRRDDLAGIRRFAAK